MLRLVPGMERMYCGVGDEISHNKSLSDDLAKVIGSRKKLQPQDMQLIRLDPYPILMINMTCLHDLSSSLLLWLSRVLLWPEMNLSWCYDDASVKFMANPFISSLFYLLNKPRVIHM